MLELDRVVKRYRGGGEEVRAVNGVSLRIEPGEMVALRGPSGSGKTTLLLLIAALLAPDAGAIRFEGRDLAHMSESQASDYLHHDVGFIYQNPQLMPRVSAIENAALKLMLGGIGQNEARERAVTYLERVGMGQRLLRTPERLSAGERQRVAIARALASEPRLILADEPTGNLDTARSSEIVRLLHSIAHKRGAAVLLVTHDPEAAGVADHNHVLRDGRLIDDPRTRSNTDHLRTHSNTDDPRTRSNTDHLRTHSDTDDPRTHSDTDDPRTRSNTDDHWTRSEHIEAVKPPPEEDWPARARG